MTRIAHYRILDKAGEGGMGVVYRAEDENLGRPVALKLLTGSLASDPLARERLLREARTASRLSHPNIATIYEVGEADGELFYAMEFIEGETLAARLRRDKLHSREAARVGLGIARALESAHDHGVVHRDIKPGNILLTPGGDVKVVDFGLAVHAPPPAGGLPPEEISTEGQRLTRPGSTAGTVTYMSPEQARGDPPNVRSDLFSLGVLLYEAVTGVHPFERPSAFGTVAAIVHDEPLPPRRIDPSVDRDLEAVILACLRKDPEERPASARDVLRGLEPLAAEVPPRPLQRLARAAASRPAAAALVGAGVLAVAGILGAWSLMRPRLPADPGPRAQSLLAQGRGHEARGASRRNLDLAEGAYRDALRVEPGHPLIEAELASVLARKQLLGPDPTGLDESRDGVGTILREWPELGPAWLAKAWLAIAAGDDEGAVRAARRAGEADPSDWRAHAVLGEALARSGNAGGALAEFRRGVDTDPGNAAPRTALATKLLEMGRDDEAAVEFGKVLELAPSHATALHNLAAIHLRSGRVLDAIADYEKLLRVQPDADAAANLGSAYFLLGKLEAAIRSYETALVLDPDNPDHARNLAEAREESGDRVEARLGYEAAAVGYERAAAAPGASAWPLASRAFCLAKLGRVEEARRAAGEAIEAEPGSPLVLYTAAQVHALAGDRGRCFELVRRSVAAGYPRDAFRQDAAFRPLLDDPEFLRALTTP